MEDVKRWAEGAFFPVTRTPIEWDQARTGWAAALATGSPSVWPGIKGTVQPSHRELAAWVVSVLTKGLPALERLASGKGCAVRALKVLARLRLQRSHLARRQALQRKSRQRRKDVATVKAAGVVLRRYAVELADGTPMAVVRAAREAEHGRSLYRWTLAILEWADVVLRSPTPATGPIPQREALVAALALQRLGASVRDIGELLLAAGLSSYPTYDEDRTKQMLRRARRDKAIVASAERVLAVTENVPVNVPATTLNQPQTTPASQRRKEKPPR